MCVCVCVCVLPKGDHVVCVCVCSSLTVYFADCFMLVCKCLCNLVSPLHSMDAP